MKNFFHSRDGASKGAALMIVLAFVVLLTGLALAYFSRAGTDRQLAQSSYNDTSADLLARSALDVVVGDFKQEIINGQPVSATNIQPTPYPAPIPADIPNLIRYSSGNAAASRASSVSSTAASANGRSISRARWNSHYLIPRATPGPGQNWNTIYSDPVPSFTPAPDWVLVTAQGPTPSPSPNQVIGRYAFAVYDEGGLLDMSLAGYPSWQDLTLCSANPSPTPWLVNVGRKGIVAFADLTALGPFAPPQSQIDKIVGWRNYAMTQQPGSFSLPPGTPAPSFPADCTKQDWYGSYLLYFGDPPFIIDNPADKLAASTYPFTSVPNYVSSSRTDQAFMTRQQLLRLRSSIGFSQNVLQYMGTFSRERNWPAPDWPGLAGRLSEGRFNLNNLALVQPNPDACNIDHGRKVGWRTGKNRNHLCGDSEEVHKLFGLFWVQAEVIGGQHAKGEWRYIGNTGPLPGATASPTPHSLNCLIPNRQNDFFEILDYALFPLSASVCETDDEHVRKTFSTGASLIDQYDSGEACPATGPNNRISQPAGCDLDSHAVGNNWNKKGNASHTTVILYGHGSGNSSRAYGMELDYSPSGPNNTNGDEPYDPDYRSENPHRPDEFAPNPPANTQVINHAFNTVGDFGYGIVTSTGGPTPGPTPPPTLKFWDSTSNPPFQYAPVLDFFSYNPISSAYPRAGIVNLYTRNAPVLAAILSRTLKTDAAGAVVPSPSPVISGTPYAGSEAQRAADAIVAQTQSVLAGTASPAVQQADLTRAIAGRLTNAAVTALGWQSTSDETKGSIARALAEMGQTRTWNLMIDVIAQTGRYAPGTASVTDANKFTVEGEKRYWLHVALGRDLNTDGSIDVLGTQLEEVIE